ncbi:MAG TPA: hypothetical protein P5293_00320 [Bacteroidales bacterium]|nr:hypothetical protein [Bacteroidales bacterium]
MASIKVTESFEDLTGHTLLNVSYIKLFNIMKEEDGTLFLNIFRSYEINESLFRDVMYYSVYEVQEEDWWELISNGFYNSVGLWWVTPLANKVINPFEELDKENDIQVLVPSVIPILLREIRDIGEL